ncbi:MAG: SOS response-associated peptidase [Caulobacterales bacterium]
MCNRYGYQHPYNALVGEFSELGPIHWDGLEPNAPRDQIRPTDKAPVVRPTRDGGYEVAELRWGLIPWFHKKPVKEWKPLTTNARSETVATTGAYRDAFKRHRCLVPATSFYEWTANPDDPKGRKLMWKFTVPAQETFAFPGLWDRADTPDGPIESYTLLTTAAGPDMTAYHTRQPVILDRADWSEWLDLTHDPSPLLHAGAAGSIVAERFTDAT